MHKWVNYTLMMAKRDLDEVQVPMLFIRLFAILVDMPNYVTPSLKVFRDEARKARCSLQEVIVREITRDASMRRHLLALVEVESALKKIRSAFSAEDIFAITYFRHANCHPVLKDYKVKLQIEGRILIFDAKKYEKFLDHSEIDELELCKKAFSQLQALQGELTLLEQCLRRL
jgi:hypothetical protein